MTLYVDGSPAKTGAAATGIAPTVDQIRFGQSAMLDGATSSSPNYCSQCSLAHQGRKELRPR